jgi:hypothetical protein
MKTKTLLIAAAALAAGVMSSHAQVYSQNIVGYVNVVLPGNGQFTLVGNPFDDGNGNQLTNILSSALPKQSQALVWNGSGYSVYQRGGTPPVWNGNTSLPPGTGFWVRNGSSGSLAPSITNTFVGSVIVSSGQSVTNVLPVGYSLQASPIPYAGNIAVSGQAGGDTNIDFGTPLGKQSQLLVWDPIAQGYTIAQKGGTPAVWNNTVAVGVGQGFFVNNKNGPATNVVEIAP